MLITASLNNIKCEKWLITLFFCLQAQHISVVDISGGCGAMYEIVVETKEFKGLSRVKQHQVITDTLKTEIKDMHGLRIHTSIPDS